MTEHRPLHLSFILVKFLTHQGQHTRLSSIFGGPYISHLIQGMGQLEELEEQIIVGGITFLRMDTLRSIGMVLL